MKDIEKNRQIVISALFNQKYVKRINKGDLPLEIVGAEKDETLKKIFLRNLPCSENSDCNIYKIFLEIDKSIFSFPPGFKKAENAIIFFTLNTLYIILIELKTSLKPFTGKDNGHIETVRKKFADSLGKIRKLLTHFNIDTKDLSIKFIGFIAYNNDLFTRHATIHQSLKTTDFYKILHKIQKNNLIEINDCLGNKNLVELFFLQNDNVSINPEEFTVDLKTIFDNDDFENGIYTDNSLEN